MKSISPYFIKHPVVTIVLNAMIVVLGLLCLFQLSLREYPDVRFSSIMVITTYPNASAELVESGITAILEDRLAEIAGLDTITSKSSTGRSEITLYFRAGVAIDHAFNVVQNAVSNAKALLPSSVQSPLIVSGSKSVGIPFMAVALASTMMDFGALTHYAHINLKNAFRHIQGIGSIDIWGQPYTYQIRLSRDQLFTFGINVDEVMAALMKSHVLLPVGNYQDHIPSTLQIAPQSIADYENIIIKPHPQHPVFLKSLATVNLGTDDTRFRVRIRGHAGLVISIDKASDANPLEVSRLVHQTIHDLQSTLPEHLKMDVIIDQADFVKASIRNIYHAIGEAIILVLIIVFILLRHIRATCIPLITIPISLLGAFIFLKGLGFSLNLMTLLAVVLAVGIVVDDAIVVLENIWRYKEQGQSSLVSAIKGSREIGFAIIAMTLTLISVYIPIAFIPGMLGQFFIEFAVALAGSVLVSGVVALTLSPMMCAYLLESHPVRLWPAVDLFLVRLMAYYKQLLSILFKYSKTVGFIAGMTVIISIFLYQHLERETAPKEDRGLVGIYVPHVVGEHIDVLDSKLAMIEKDIQFIPDYQNQLTFLGHWGGSILLPLKPHAQRQYTDRDIVEKLRSVVNHYPSFEPYVWNWNTGLPGLDDAGSGLTMALVISTSDSFKHLFSEIERLKSKLQASGQFGVVRCYFQMDTLGYTIKINHVALAKLGLTTEQVAKTIEVFFSGDTTQTFEKDGVIYYLTVSGQPVPWMLDELYLTTAQEKRVSLGAIATMMPAAQPATLEHFQQMRSATLYVDLSPGMTIAHSSQVLWKMVKDILPSSYRLTWLENVKMLNESSYLMIFLLCLSLIFIYAILAVQFENFIDPFIILFTAPLACVGALLPTYFLGQTLNIYTQVGLITLIGLVSKHGILMVEFANQLQKTGLSWQAAITEAAQLRLRPILMTTAAMIFGTVPLVLSHDAGAEARHAIGVVLIGGLSLGTLFTLLVLPVVYKIFKCAKNNAIYGGDLSITP